MATVRAISADDFVIAHIDRERASRCWCPDGVRHLLTPPGDDASIVDQLRHAIAWALESDTMAAVARDSGVPAGRIMAFLTASAAGAGAVLSLDQAASLAAHVELRLEDRYLRHEHDTYFKLAEPYLEMAGLSYALALRTANARRRAFRRRRGIDVRVLG